MEPPAWLVHSVVKESVVHQVSLVPEERMVFLVKQVNAVLQESKDRQVHQVDRDLLGEKDLPDEPV